MCSSAGDRSALELLTHTGVFRGVPVSLIEEYVGRFPLRKFACETTLKSPGDENDEVFIVLSGTLKIAIGTEGRGESFDIGPGSCVGEMSVIDKQPVSAFIIANADTRLLVIDGQSFIQDFLSQPQISRNQLSELSERLRRHGELVIKRVRLEAQMEQLQRELGIAKEIQESLLPKEPLFPGDPRIGCKGQMRTAKAVGGDFYDIFFLDADNLFFVIGDVCGKGLPAALFMVRAVSALRAQSWGSYLEESYIALLFENLNKLLCLFNDKQQFLTAFCGILNVRSGTIRFVNAGHNAPLISDATGHFHYLEEPTNPFVGMFEGMTYRAGTVNLPPGGSLFLYTDGITEAETQDGVMYEEERLLDHLNELGPGCAATLVTQVFNAVDGFVSGAEQSDDITVLAITRSA